MPNNEGQVLNEEVSFIKANSHSLKK